MTIASQHASQEITKLYQQEPPAPSLQQASAPSMESNNNPLHKLELQLADGEVSALRNISALCKEGTERTGHGVVLTLNGDGIQPSLFDRRLRLSVDLHGSQVFTALPSGLGFLAPSLLPQEVTATSGQGLDRVSLTMGVGLTQLSRGRVDQVLQTLMDAGDEPFVFEFRDATNNQLVVSGIPKFRVEIFYGVWRVRYSLQRRPSFIFTQGQGVSVCEMVEVFDYVCSCYLAGILES